MRGIASERDKMSTVDLKALYPQYTAQSFAELELISENGISILTMWTGKSYDNCEVHWEKEVKQTRSRKFEIPGIPYHFVIVHKTIYYRRNGDLG